MYFQAKNTLKKNLYYNPKHTKIVFDISAAVTIQNIFRFKIH
jgi:hypothetical protein